MSRRKQSNPRPVEVFEEDEDSESDVYSSLPGSSGEMFLDESSRDTSDKSSLISESSGGAVDSSPGKLRKSKSQIKAVLKNGMEVFECPVCSVKLTSAQELTVHIRSHNSPSSSGASAASTFDCKICGRSMSSQSSLDRHTFVHSGERPYACRLCSGTFTTNGNLIRHLKTHSNKVVEANVKPSDAQASNQLRNQSSPTVKTSPAMSTKEVSSKAVTTLTTTIGTNKTGSPNVLDKTIQLQRGKAGIEISLLIKADNQKTPQKAAVQKGQSSSDSKKSRRASVGEDNDWDPSMSEESLGRRQRLRRYWREKQREKNKKSSIDKGAEDSQNKKKKKTYIKKAPEKVITVLGRTRSKSSPVVKQDLAPEGIPLKDNHARKSHTSSSSVRGIKRELSMDSDSRDSLPPVVNKRLATVNEYHLGKVSPSKRQLERRASAQIGFLKKAESEMDETYVQPTPLLPYQPYHCPACNKTFLCQFGLDSHLESHPNMAIRCMECRLTFRTPRGLNMHKYMVHNNQKPDTPNTEKAVQQSGLLSPRGFSDLNFMDFSTRKFPFVAKTWCEKNIRKSSSLYHPFSCAQCRKAFPCASAFHLHSHDTSANTCCELCAIDFHTNSAMESHKLSHSVDNVGSPEISNMEKNKYLTLVGLQSSEMKLDKEDVEKENRKIMKQDSDYYFKLEENNPERNNVTVNLFPMQDIAEGPVSTNPGVILKPKVESGILLVSSPLPAVAYNTPSVLQHSAPVLQKGVVLSTTVLNHQPIKQALPIVVVPPSSTLPTPSRETNDFSDINKILHVTNKSCLLSMSVNAGSVTNTVALPKSHGDEAFLKAATEPTKDPKPVDLVPKKGLPKYTHLIDAKQGTTATKCTVCLKYFSGVVKLRDHMSSHLYCYQCCFCDFPSQDGVMMNIHLKMRHTYKPCQCIVCGEAFQNRATCQRHFLYKHGDIQMNNVKHCACFIYNPKVFMSGCEDYAKTTCKACGFASKSALAHKQHLLVECGNLFFGCSKCDSLFSVVSDCKQHILSSHSFELLTNQGSAVKVLKYFRNQLPAMQSRGQPKKSSSTTASDLITKGTLSSSTTSPRKIDSPKFKAKRRRQVRDTPYPTTVNSKSLAVNYQKYKDPVSAQYKCPDCSKQFNQPAVLQFHRKYHQHKPKTVITKTKSPGNSFGSDSSGDLASVSKLLKTADITFKSFLGVDEDQEQPQEASTPVQPMKIALPPLKKYKDTVCPKCFKSFKDNCSMISHALCWHRVFVGTTDNYLKQPAESTFKCEFCSTSFPSPGLLFVHLDERHDSSCTMGKPRRHLSKRTVLRQPFAEPYNESKDAECPECKATFPDSTSMISHALNRHMMIVGTGDKINSKREKSMYQCEYCVRTFSVPGVLFLHLQKVHPGAANNRELMSRKSACESEVPKELAHEGEVPTRSTLEREVHNEPTPKGEVPKETTHEEEVPNKSTGEVVPKTSACEGEELNKSTCEGKVPNTSTHEGEVVKSTCEGEVPKISAHKGEAANKSTCEGKVPNTSTHEGEVVKSTCEGEVPKISAHEGEAANKSTCEGKVPNMSTPEGEVLKSTCEGENVPLEGLALRLLDYAIKERQMSSQGAMSRQSLTNNAEWSRELPEKSDDCVDDKNTVLLEDLLGVHNRVVDTLVKSADTAADILRVKEEGDV